MESALRAFIVLACIAFVDFHCLLMCVIYALKDIRKYLSEQDKIIKNKFL